MGSHSSVLDCDERSPLTPWPTKQVDPLIEGQILYIGTGTNQHDPLRGSSGGLRVRIVHRSLNGLVRESGSIVTSWVYEQSPRSRRRSDSVDKIQKLVEIVVLLIRPAIRLGVYRNRDRVVSLTGCDQLQLPKVSQGSETNELLGGSCTISESKTNQIRTLNINREGAGIFDNRAFGARRGEDRRASLRLEGNAPLIGSARVDGLQLHHIIECQIIPTRVGDISLDDWQSDAAKNACDRHSYAPVIRS